MINIYKSALKNLKLLTYCSYNAVSFAKIAKNQIHLKNKWLKRGKKHKIASYTTHSKLTRAGPDGICRLFPPHFLKKTI